MICTYSQERELGDNRNSKADPIISFPEHRPPKEPFLDGPLKVSSEYQEKHTATFWCSSDRVYGKPAPDWWMAICSYSSCIKIARTKHSKVEQKMSHILAEKYKTARKDAATSILPAGSKKFSESRKTWRLKSVLGPSVQWFLDQIYFFDLWLKKSLAVAHLRQGENAQKSKYLK